MKCFVIACACVLAAIVNAERVVQELEKPFVSDEIEIGPNLPRTPRERLVKFLEDAAGKVYDASEVLATRLAIRRRRKAEKPELERKLMGGGYSGGGFDWHGHAPHGHSPHR